MNKPEYYFAILNRIDRMLSFAEAKVSFMLAYLGLLLAVLGNQADEIKFLLQKTSMGVVITTLTLLQIIVVIFFITLFYISNVVLPRLKFSKRDSLSHFADISKMPEDKYIAKMKQIKDNDSEEDILSQIHATSFIVNHKFENIRIATYLIGIFTIFWLVIMFVIIMFSA